MSELKLSDFDLLGIIELDKEELDEKLKPLTTLTLDGKYLSRSSLFWNKYSCKEARDFREELGNYLKTNTKLSSKNTFIILDYMANFSGKVYYKLCEDYICNKCTLDDVNYAKKCLTEDISNIINLLENLQIQTNFHSLPNLEGNIPTRNIECNNMALLYLFTKSLEPPKDYNILNTGLGGIFIGPFFHCIYGNNWTNMLKSKYAKELNLSNINSFNDLIVDKDTFKNKNVLFLDDNVGTGTTMTEIRNEFINLGYNFKCGAVQYNWINYYKVEIGEKDIERFDPESIDYVTQINYPGHKLLEHAIEIIGGKRDINGNDISNKLLEKGQAGSNYIDYKASKHYYDEDIKSLQEKSIKYAKNANFEIYSKPLDELKFNSVLTEDSKKLMRNIYELTNKLFNAEKYIKYENN